MAGRHEVSQKWAFLDELMQWSGLMQEKFEAMWMQELTAIKLVALSRGAWLGYHPLLDHSNVTLVKSGQLKCKPVSVMYSVKLLITP